MADRHPADARPWQWLSNIHARATRWPDALECAQQSVSRAPQNPGALLLLAQCLLGSGRRRDALAVAERLLQTPSDRADWNDALGTLLTHCDDPMRGRLLYERALSRAPGHSGYLYNLATAQRMTGEIEAAEASLDAVIAATPDDVRAYYTRSDLRTQSPQNNHIDEMVRVLRRAAGRPPDETMLSFALAKELEDVARYEESFAYLALACAIQRRTMRYDVQDDISTIEHIIERHDRAMLRQGEGADAADCVFVFGLPRSGTTLVERILASHSAVQAAGELEAFPAETINAVQRLCGRAVGKREFVERALDADPRALGQAYLDSARPPYADRTSRFIDKQPLNYLYAGLIARALPRARLVALARDPMDSCYAMFKTLFAGAYPFSYDLHDLGRYYVAWHSLIRHWQSVLEDRLLIVQYEDLVQHQEAMSRRIVEHCGLPWEESCLAFQDQTTPVTTASAVQVRRPMYASSIGQWTHFRHQLRPLSDFLARHEPQGGWRLA